MSNLHFRVMSALIGLRNRLSPRGPILEEVGPRPGQVVLDHGCGPGGNALPAAGMVGPSGHVYALDIHPMALERVEGAARKRRLGNVTTILSDREAGLPPASVDVVLLYDVLHLLSEPGGVLEELSRILGDGGVLSVWGHDLDGTERLFEASNVGRFALEARGRHTLTYVKA